ncbi:MAG TPA: FtsX-like permease family protein [Pirellulaceae bacterium]|nr:FtsX-like permease family protein [Pirellulaceae bacterium]HMO93596.1 FtsX-like permease family protein [Pirellulaceae bacterium]HMP70520.1 FtsX-like permease family protein [Pirellulaceae bacterium]
MISALDRKLIRDLWHIRGQALAICAVIGAGVSMFTMAMTAMVSLIDSKDSYYDRYRFADVFAHVKRAPRSMESRIQAIPGIAQVELRIVVDVTLSVESLARPVTGRLISIPEDRQPNLNSVYLRQGRWIEPNRTGEVLVAESFALAHELRVGDRITAVINGRFQRLKIVGIALSPEYVIEIAPGSLLPDTEQFGVFWMGQSQLEAAYDMKQSFNHVSAKLLRGANEPEVLRKLDDLLERFGSRGAYGRLNHVSDQFVSDEIRQLQATAIVAPSIFLFVASFLLNIVVSRIVGLQREQIAALKAFGYTNWQIVLHYFKLVLLITIVGTLIGAVSGIWLGKSLTIMYARFYKFPIFHFRVETWILLLVTALSVGAALLGTWVTLRRAAKLPPAEAMRPEPPAQYRSTLVERIGIARFLPHVVRMILRKLERSLFKTLMNCSGIALAVASLILGSFSLDAVNFMMDFMFRLSQRQDATLTFVEPAHVSVVHDVRHLPGVLQCEPFRSVPVRLRNGHRHRRCGIMGLAEENELYRIFADNELEVKPPPDGLLLSDKLAQLLNVGVGTEVEVEVLEGKQRRLHLPVAAIIREFSGTNAYMNLEALNRWMGEGPLASGVFVKSDEAKRPEFYAKVKETPRIAGITDKTAMLQSFERTIAENLLVMRGFNILFAAVIAFGVVYNATRISLSEQSRDLATLRVIGFTRYEVSAILLGELAIITAVALPVGCLIGYVFAAVATLGLDTELYRIPLVISPQTYANAIATVIVATIVSGLIVRRKIDELDLVSVLKTKD